VKKAGLFAITEGVKILALEAGEMGGGTWERIRLLAERKVLTREEADDLEASFNFLVILRLRGQVAAIREGRAPVNHIGLNHFNRMEKGRLRLALEGVRTFQGFLKRHFRLDMIR
jgi:CBS domain-containing protein